MMRVNGLLITALMTMLAFTLPISAGQKDRAGTNAGNTLRISPSAAASAMGDAYTGVAQATSEALFYNPAGLAWPTKREVSGSYQNMVLDIGQGSISYVHPINSKSSWGLLAQYVNFGSTQRTLVSGNAGVNAGTFEGHDVALGLSYGARAGEDWAYGVTVKGFTSSIDNVTASAIAADAGLSWKPSNSGFSIGVAVKNLGSTVKYDVATERLPIEFRGGGELRLFRKEDGSAPLRFTVDISKVAREGFSGHFGAEYTFAKMLSIRAGWDGGAVIDNGLTVGGGVKLKGMNIDYSFVPFGDVGNNHRVGMKYAF